MIYSATQFLRRYVTDLLGKQWKLTQQDENEYTINGGLGAQASREFRATCEQLRGEKKSLQGGHDSDSDFDPLHDLTVEDIQVESFSRQMSQKFDFEVQQQCWDNLPAELVAQILSMHREKETEKAKHRTGREN